MPEFEVASAKKLRQLTRGTLNGVLDFSSSPFKAASSDQKQGKVLGGELTGVEGQGGVLQCSLKKAI